MLTSKNLLNEYLDNSDEEDGTTSCVASEPPALSIKLEPIEKSKKRLIAMPQYHVKKSSVCDVSKIFSVVDPIEEKSLNVDATQNHLPSACSFLHHLPEPLNWNQNKKNTLNPSNDSKINSGVLSYFQPSSSNSTLEGNLRIESQLGLEKKEEEYVNIKEDQDKNEDNDVDDSVTNSCIFSLSMNSTLLVPEVKEDKTLELNILPHTVCNSDEMNTLKVVDLTLQETKDPTTCLVPNSDTYEETSKNVSITSSLPKGREWQGFLLSERNDSCHESGAFNSKTYVIHGSDLSNPDWKENFRRGDGRLKPQSNLTAGVNCFNIALTSSRRQRQKNQINSLAQEVANKEHEYSERASQQRYSKYKTQMKYGW